MHVHKTTTNVQIVLSGECLPLVVAWLWGTGHPADEFTTVGRGLLSSLVRWRRTGGFKTSLGTAGTPKIVTAVCKGWGEASGRLNRRSCIPAWPGRSQHGTPPVSRWRHGGGR